MGVADGLLWGQSWVSVLLEAALGTKLGVGAALGTELGAGVAVLGTELSLGVAGGLLWAQSSQSALCSCWAHTVALPSSAALSLGHRPDFCPAF